MNRSFSPADDRICFVSVENVRQLVSRVGLPEMILGISSCIESDFKRWNSFHKSARVTHATGDGFIELMPVCDAQVYGFKYVHCHPQNSVRSESTVTGFGALARVDNGHPFLLAEMTLMTALRTAATSILAACHLAPEGASTMAIIGNGAQSEFQAIGFQHGLGIDAVRLYDIDPMATRKAARNLAGSGLEVVACGSAQEAVKGAEIITTCTASVENGRVLTDNMVGKGVHINALGGDCAGKTELHVDILRRSDIFVEFPPQSRIEGEIQQLDPDHPVTELWRVVRGEAAGRVSTHQTTVFDSVGFAIEDLAALRYVHALAIETGLCDWIDLLARPADPKDLFGVLAAQPVETK